MLILDVSDYVLKRKSGEKVEDEEARQVVDGYPLNVDLYASINPFISRKKVDDNIEREENVDGYLHACKEDAPTRVGES